MTTVVIFISYLMNELIYSLFIELFLTSKSKLSFLRTLVINEIIVTICFLFLYEDFVFKMILIISTLLITMIVFYSDSILKKIMCTISIIIITQLAELPLIFFMKIVLGTDVISSMGMWQTIYMFGTLNFAIVVIGTLELIIFNKIDFKISSYIKLILAITGIILTAFFFVSYALIATKQLSVAGKTEVEYNHIVVFIVIIINIILSIYTFRMANSLYQEIYEREFIKKRYELQARQLYEYQLLKENESIIRQVRHDITNYLQVRRNFK